MGLNSTSVLKVIFQASTTDETGSTDLISKVYKEVIQNFVDGAGAGSADDIVEGTIENSNSATALSTLNTTKGAAVSAQTKIKAILIINEGAAATTISSSISGLPVGALAGATSGVTPFIFAGNASAAGWACTAASTITSNGTAGQYIRVFLLLS